MESKEPQECDFEDGFDSLASREDFHEERRFYQRSSLSWQRVKGSMLNMKSEGRCRLAVIALALLAAVLLIVDIRLGAHYNNLRDTHLTFDDVKRIREDLSKLKDDYKTAVGAMKDAQKQTEREMSRQTETNWEFEHQTKTTKAHQAEIEKTTQDIEKMRSHLPMINNGCKHCPEGWRLINSMCYYFSFLGNNEKRSWPKAREFCQIQGGDLLIIRSKDEENTTVSYLMNYQEPSAYDEDLWIGLRDSEEEGTWKWVDGTFLVEGYWKDGEPNDAHNNEDCATVSPRKNIFKAWNDDKCNAVHKWICEKKSSSSR